MQDMMRIMTFNIRQDKGNDGLDNWVHRKDHAASMLDFHRVDVCGMQEAMINQVKDLEKRLPDYDWIGVGREDGAKEGEYAPIFYNRNLLEVMEQGTFWLSETPELCGSIGWDADCTRIASWGHFINKETGKAFWLINTHLDHMGQVARLKSVALLFDKIQSFESSEPIILMGDFNAVVSSDVYAALTSEVNGLADTAVMSRSKSHGPSFTFHGFKGNDLMTLDQRRRGGDRELLSPIDYIFVNNEVDVLHHGVLADQWDGRFPSDHMPVVADVIMK